MPTKILIAYCTRSGSTREVAIEMGRIMRDAGVQVEVKAMAEVQSLADEQAVILGGALYVGRFAKQFHRFLMRFARELTKTHPWIFVLGPTENVPKHFATADERARKELEKYSWLHPADVRIFGGKFDPKNVNLPFPFNLAMKLPANPLHKMPASDIREWDWIRSWAKSIAEQLNAVV